MATLRAEFPQTHKDVLGRLSGSENLRSVYKCRFAAVYLCWTDMAGNSFSYRVNPLTTTFNISPPPPLLLQRIANQKTRWDNDTFNPETLNLAAITKRDSGECFFACIAMALYGTEDEHKIVRQGVCNFIETEIVPNYYTLSYSDKLRLMLLFNEVSDVPYPPVDFQKIADNYLHIMRGNRTCGTGLELMVASYMFRLEIILLNKTTHFSVDGTSHVKYNKPTMEMNGANIRIPGLIDDGIGSVSTEDAAGLAAAQQPIVMMFVNYTMESNQIKASGAEKKARRVDNPADRHKRLLDKEDVKVGHYQLMARFGNADILKMQQKTFDKHDRGATGKQKLAADDKGKDEGGPSKPRKTKDASLDIKTVIKEMKKTEYTSLLENMKSIKQARRYLRERKARTGNKPRVPYHPHELTDEKMMQIITKCEKNIANATHQTECEESKLAAANGSKHVAPDINAPSDDTKNRLSNNCLKVALEIGMNDDIATHINREREIHKLEVRRADINKKYTNSIAMLTEIKNDITRNEEFTHSKPIRKALQTDLDNIAVYRTDLQKCQKTDDVLMALLVAMK